MAPRSDTRLPARLMMILLFRTIPTINIDLGGRSEMVRRGQEAGPGATTTLRPAATTTTTTTQLEEEQEEQEAPPRLTVRRVRVISTPVAVLPYTTVGRHTRPPPRSPPRSPAASPSPPRSPRRPPAPRTCSTPTPPSSRPPP